MFASWTIPASVAIFSAVSLSIWTLQSSISCNLQDASSTCLFGVLQQHCKGDWSTTFNSGSSSQHCCHGIEQHWKPQIRNQTSQGCVPRWIVCLIYKPHHMAVVIYRPWSDRLGSPTPIAFKFFIPSFCWQGLVTEHQAQVQDLLRNKLCAHFYLSKSES